MRTLIRGVGRLRGGARRLLGVAGRPYLWARVLLAPPGGGPQRAYDDAALVYGDFHWLWLAAAGASAERRLRRDLRTVVAPGARVLDAGEGSGRAWPTVRAASCPAGYGRSAAGP